MKKDKAKKTEAKGNNYIVNRIFFSLRKRMEKTEKRSKYK